MNQVEIFVMARILIMFLVSAICLFAQEKQEDPEVSEKLEILKKYRNKNEQQKILQLKFLLESKKRREESKRIVKLEEQNKELQEMNKQQELRLASLEKQVKDLRTEIPLEIWEKCWNEEHEYFDFTHAVWSALSHDKQVEYARKYQVWYAKNLGKPVEKEVEVGGTKITMVLVPPGKFWMGSPEEEAKRKPNEQRHKVWISKGFWIGKYEVTQKQWREVMGNNPANFKEAEENAPVESVSWNDCQKFCKKTGLNLPTEAQWEYACRAGTLSAFNIGNDVSTDQVNYEGNHPYKESKGEYRKTTLAVGTLKNENSWGCYDFHGNVWEWCNDWYEEGYYKKSENGEIKDLSGPDNGSNRCIRGGSWGDSGENLRAAFRFQYLPSNSTLSIGLRVVFRIF